jgi:hypothetical protein
MADSLNGILIGGLLGNNVGTLIVAQFNLGWWGVEVVEPPYVPPPIGSGGDPGGEAKRPKVINIWVRLGTKTYQRSYRVSEKRATQIVKVINRTNTLKKAVSVKISAMKKKD